MSATRGEATRGVVMHAVAAVALAAKTEDSSGSQWTRWRDEEEFSNFHCNKYNSKYTRVSGVSGMSPLVKGGHLGRTRGGNSRATFPVRTALRKLMISNRRFQTSSRQSCYGQVYPSSPRIHPLSSTNTIPALDNNRPQASSSFF